MKENIDEWIRLMGEDLDKTAYMWADEIGKALNGGNTGELDTTIESLKAHTIAPDTTSVNAAEQIARLVKWRVKLLKFGMNTNALVNVVQAITQGLDSLILKVADDTFVEEIELDYLPANPESMALPRSGHSGKTDRLNPDPEQEPPAPPEETRNWGSQDADLSGKTRRRVPRT